MTGNPMLEDMNMGSDDMISNCEGGELGEKGGQIIAVSNHVNGLQHLSTKSDSFVVDMERFSHAIEKDMNANSRIKRNLSRKGSVRLGEKKIAAGERDAMVLVTSPKAALHGGSTPEKPAVVVMGSNDHSITPQIHHQITITNGTATATASATVQSKLGGKRFSFRRSSTWTVDPRRMLLFFATLSCMGTIVLIYFTLSMGKPNGDDTPVN